MNKKCSGKSVGAIIEKNNRILFLDRAFLPLGWAPPAGHIDKNEQPSQAIAREIKEETGLDALKCDLLLAEKNVPDACVMGGKFHDWWIFKCECQGEVNLNKKESKDFAWLALNEIENKADIINVWQRFLRKINL